VGKSKKSGGLARKGKKRGLFAETRRTAQPHKTLVGKKKKETKKNIKKSRKPKSLERDIHRVLQGERGVHTSWHLKGVFKKNPPSNPEAQNRGLWEVRDDANYAKKTTQTVEKRGKKKKQIN